MLYRRAFFFFYVTFLQPQPLTPISIPAFSPEPSPSELSYFMRALKGIPQSFLPFHLLFSQRHQLAFIARKIDECLGEKRKHKAQTACYLHHSDPLCSHLLGRRRATVLCNSLRNFPINAQNKLPFGETCLSLGSWDHCLEINLGASLYSFSLRLHYFHKTIA